MAPSDESGVPDAAAAETTNPDQAEVHAMEERWLRFWDEEGIYRFDRASDRPVYSIDTPPPTVSGKMHIGHAYSYNQMDFVARYKRMRGHNLFYPFGFDDNGLPTERLTEREVGVRIGDVGREEFIKKCLEVTKRFEANMEAQWRRIGTSCDWSLVYRTIEPRAIKTSQLSFLDLHEKGRVHRSSAPTIWCPECATAIAQVEAEDRELPSEFHDVAFTLEDTGEDLVISTTRPELIPACVAMFVNPDDERAKDLVGKDVVVPLFGQTVRVLADEKVDPEKGTGVVMCCTFGDLNDIDWWQANKLDLRIAIDEHGRMTDVAGAYAGKTTAEAREAIVRDLDAAGHLRGSRPIDHMVNVHERCGTPIEFLVTPQWFIGYLDLKEEFLERGDAVHWHPAYMKVRYDNWVKGLQWDWCISRQRYFGVPFPVWYCDGCGTPKVASREELPVDPVTDTPKEASCVECGGTSFTGERDVMDTWATSSLTPQIAAGWADDDALFDQVFPMSLRPQAHEIISFWAFNTIVKSHFHHDATPWSDIMISGFVKLGKGKKMSKSKGNIVEPMEVITEHSADALRYWSATGASLGEDIIWNPKDLTRAQRLVTKLRNVNRFIAAAGEPAGEPAHTDVDKWILHEYSRTVETVTRLWEAFDYTRAVKETENFLWHVFADHYVELAKGRAREGDASAIRALRTVGLGVTKLLAPVLAFATEDIYQTHYRDSDGAKSVHVSAWPEPVLDDADAHRRGEVVKDVVAAARNWKSGQKISLGAEMPEMEVVAPAWARDALDANKGDVLATLKAKGLVFVDGSDVETRPTKVTLDLAKVGPRLKGLAPKVMKVVNEMDAAKVTGDGLTVQVDGETVDLAPDEYHVETRPTVHGHEVEAVHVGEVTLLMRASP